ncbi:MBL fold metallo-hydrolase [Pseudonocardia spinosispora]|uniref:MBL fold metallo-hydrolase n=1 Tax=Pseudonocardia spinosispora TaxID=103441 RepID=UPI000429F33B|nr:MBL fold metallo-hydrolase [Pseudonocardia spinosispora]
MSTSISPKTTTGITMQLIGGPTALIEIGGLRLLTDPTFDPPGDHPVGQRTLVKTSAPSVTVESVGHVDAVLLSHDQHPDNLDASGRRLLERVPLVLSTAAAEQRLGGSTRELPVWRGITLPRPDGGELRITGVPAQHGPAGTEHLTGEVRGFVLSGAGLPTVYVSGDNASLAVVRDVADHAGPIDVAVLFAGHARSPLMDAYLTFSSDQAAQAAEILASPTVVPIHLEGWGHLTQGPGTIPDAFARRGLADRLVMLNPGEATTLPAR